MPTDFFGRVMVVFQRYGMSMLQGAGVSLRIALVAYPDFKMLEFGGGDKDFQVSDEDINIGISMKKGNTELKEAIDSVLTKMTKDDFSAMMDEAISVQPLAN